MPSPKPSSPRPSRPRRALRLLPLALALSFGVLAADAPPPPPPAPPAPPAAPGAPHAPSAEQSRALEDARRDLERAARRLADLHREYGMAAAPHAGHMPPGPAWTPMAQDRPRIGAVLARDDVRGVRIAAVTPDGPAARAGLRSGDRLLAVGDKTLDAAPSETRLYDARVALQALEADTPVRLRYERDGKAAIATVKPVRGEGVVVFSGDGRMLAPGRRHGEAWSPRRGIPGEVRIETLRAMPPVGPAQAPTGGERRIVERRHVGVAPGAADAHSEERLVDVLRIGPDGSSLLRIERDCGGEEPCAPLPLVDAFRWSGLNLAAVDAKLGRYFGTSEGVLVLGAGPGLEGLEPGDVIRKVDGRSVRTPREVMEALRGKEPATEVAVDYLRERKPASVRVRVPEARMPEMTMLEPLLEMPELPPVPPAPPAPPAPPQYVD